MKVKVQKEKQEALRDLKQGVDLIKVPFDKQEVQVNRVAEEKVAERMDE